MKLKTWLIKNRKIFWIWQIVAIVVWIAAVIFAAPYGDKLGVPQSPQRSLYWIIFDFWVLKLPTALLLASFVAARENWLAPRGKYVQGKSYPLFSTYTYTAIGFLAALFAVSGVVNFQLFDLPAAPATISIVFFNPIVGFFTLWIGDILRALVFGAGNPVLWLIGQGLIDGTIWLAIGVFYWWFRETRWGKNVIVRFIAFSVFYWVWRTFTNILVIVWLIPASLYPPTTITLLSFQFTSFVSALAGLVISEGLIRANETRRHTTDVEETPSATNEAS